MADAVATPPDTPNGAAPTTQPAGKLPLATIRGASYPLPGTAAPSVIVDYVWRLWTAQDPDSFWRMRYSARNLLLAEGFQWLDWNTRYGTWRPIPASDGRLQCTINYIRPVLRSRTQRVMSADFTWRSVPHSNNLEARDKSAVAERLLTSRYRQEEMDPKVRMARWLSDCCGVAFLKSFWNPDIGPMTNAVRPLPHPVTGQLTDYPVDAQGEPLAHPETGDPLLDSPEALQYRPGDTDTALRTLFNLRCNPEAWGWTPHDGLRWLIDAELTPITAVKARYGALAQNLSPSDDQPQLAQYQRMLRGITGRPATLAGGPSVVLTPPLTTPIPDQQSVLLMEYWEVPTEELPTGRLITLAGHTLLYDGPLPQGFVPYVPVYCEKKPFDPYGHAIVTDMDSSQCLINEQWSLVHEEIRRDVPGQWVGFDLPGVFDQLTAEEDGQVRIPLRAGYTNRPIGDLIQRMPHATINEARLAIIDRSKAAIFDLGAFHEIQRGQVPPGVDSGIAVQLLQEAENAQLEDTVRTLQESLLLWGRQHLGLARWGYGPQEERWLPGADVTKLYLTESVNGEDLPDPDLIHLDLDGFKPTSKAATRAELIDLASRQILTGPQLIGALDIGRGLEALFPSQTRHYDRARAENLAFQKGEYQFIPAPAPGSTPALPGEPPPVMMPAAVYPDHSPFLLPSEDNDDIHIAAHQDVALDNSQPWAVRQSVLMHIAEHRANEQAKMAASAAPLPPPGENGPPGAPITSARANAPEIRGLPQAHTINSQ